MLPDGGVPMKTARISASLMVMLSLLGCAARSEVTPSSEADLVELGVTVESSADPPSRAARDRFATERMPEVRAMLAEIRRVKPVGGRLRIALIDPDRGGREVLGEIYGTGFLIDARALLARAEAVTEPDIEALARETACRFPGLGRPPLLEGLNQVLALPFAALKGFLIEALEHLLDPALPADAVSSLFGRTGATTYVSPGSACGFIVFGEAPVGGTVELRHSDTVLHEIGHFVDLSTRRIVRDRSQPPTKILDEALADVVSHAFTQRNCHRLRESDSDCSRTMTGPAQPISPEADAYQNGQAIRAAAWTLVEGVPLETSGARIFDARDETLATTASIDPSSLLRKPTPEERAERFRYDKAAAERFLKALTKP